MPWTFTPVASAVAEQELTGGSYVELGRTFHRRRGIPRGRCTASRTSSRPRRLHAKELAGVHQEQELIQSNTQTCRKTENKEHIQQKIERKTETPCTMQILIHSLGVLPPSGLLKPCRISFKLGDLCSYRRHYCFRSAKESKVASA